MGSTASKKRRETSQPVTRVSLIGSASPASPSGPVAAAPNGATAKTEAKTVRTFTEEYVRYLVEVEKRDVVIIHGKVYDVTEFTPSHPGGASAIRRAAGTEAGELFDSIYGESARPMLAPYFIGDLAPPGGAELSAAEVQRRIMEDGRALLVLHGNVYDVTDFVASHPGGRASIMARLGEEAGDLFDRIHGRRAKASAAAYRIGRLLKEQGTGGTGGTGEQGGEQWFVGTVLRVEAAAADVRYVTVSSPARLALLPGGHIDIDIGTPSPSPSPSPDPCPCPCPIPCPIPSSASASASSGGSSGWTRPFTPFLCEAECFTLAVRCYPGGAASAMLHALLPGALLRYRGPRAPPWRACADVRLQRTAAADRRVLLVCGGTGVAPMYTIAADLLETRAAAVTVAACFRCPDALLLRRELAALAARHGGDGAFRLHYVFSRMAKEMVEPMAKEMTEACAVHSGRFGEGVARALGHATVAVLCGPPGFAEDVAEELVAAGVCAEDALHEL